MEEFEKWLREQCFGKPTLEAYDLASAAWSAASVHVAKQCALTARGLTVKVGDAPAKPADGEWIADQIEYDFLKSNRGT